MKIVLCSTITAALLLSQSVVAETTQTFQCTLNGASRTISIEYPKSAALPCLVTYKKDQGDAANLWNAEKTTGYCQENGLAFVEKQRGWGWQCNEETTKSTAAAE